MTNKQFGDFILNLMRDHPEKWVFDKYHAHFGALDIWIANRPYADLVVYDTGPRIGTFWQRRRIRKEMDYLRTADAACKAVTFARLET